MTEKMAGSGHSGGESAFESMPLDVPTEARQHFERAGAYEARDDLESALWECDLTIQLAPAWAEAHNLRGIVLDAMGRSEEALAAYREALRCDPAFGEAQENLSEVEAEVGSRRQRSTGKPAESRRVEYRPGCVVVAVLLIAVFAVLGGVWPGVRLIGELGQLGPFADKGMATFLAYFQLAVGVLLLVSAAGIWAMKKWATAIYVGFVVCVLGVYLLTIFTGLSAGGFQIFDSGQFAVAIIELAGLVIIALGLVNLWRKGELS